MAVLFGIVLQVLAIYLPILNKALHTVPLGWDEWEIILLFLVLVILTIEITKALFILYYKKHKKYA